MEARSSSVDIAASASLEVRRNVGSVSSRLSGVRVPETSAVEFNSDISRASRRPAACHSVIKLSYSWQKKRRYIFINSIINNFDKINFSIYSRKSLSLICNIYQWLCVGTFAREGDDFARFYDAIEINSQPQ